MCIRDSPCSLYTVTGASNVLFTLQSKKSRKPKAEEAGGTGAKPKSGKPTDPTEPTKAVDYRSSSAGRTSENASDALYAGLADNKMFQ